MNFAAMRAGELLRFNFSRAPEFFFNCPAGIGQLERCADTDSERLEFATPALAYAYAVRRCRVHRRLSLFRTGAVLTRTAASRRQVVPLALGFVA